MRKLIFIFLILLLPLINAEVFPQPTNDIEVGFRDGLGRQGVNIQLPEQVLNVSNASVFHADTANYWDSLDTPADIFANGMWTKNGNELYVTDTSVNRWAFGTNSPSNDGLYVYDNGASYITIESETDEPILLMINGDLDYGYIYMPTNEQDFIFRGDSDVARMNLDTGNLTMDGNATFDYYFGTKVLVEELFVGQGAFNTTINQFGVLSSPLINVDSGKLNFDENTITSNTGFISFNDENATTTGIWTVGDLYITNTIVGNFPFMGNDGLVDFDSEVLSWDGVDSLNTIYDYNTEANVKVTDFGKYYAGSSDDVSFGFNGTSGIIKQEVGSTPFYFQNSLLYNFDNDIVVNGVATIGGIADTNQLIIKGTTGTDITFFTGTSFTGGFLFSGGSKVTEQTGARGGTDRMLYLLNGARIDFLNEAGSNWETDIYLGETRHRGDGTQFSSNYGLAGGGNGDVWTYFDNSDWIFDSRDITPNDEIHFTDFDKYSFDNDMIVGGDLNVTGNITGNQIYGEMWNYTSGTTGWNFDIDNAGTYYNLTNLDATHMNLNGFGFEDNAQVDGGSNLVTQVAGHYKLDLSISFSGQTAGGLYGFSLAHDFNESKHRNCYGRREARTDVGNIGITCLMDLDIGDKLVIMIENENSARDIQIHTVNLNAVRIGN